MPCPAGSHCDMRCHLVLLGRFPHLGHHQEDEQKGANDIHRERRLPPVTPFDVRGRREAGIAHEDIDAIQLLSLLRKGFDARKVTKVDKPDIEFGRAVGMRGADGSDGSVAFALVAAGDDDTISLEAGEVASGFEAEANVGAGGDDGSACLEGVWDGEVLELAGHFVKKSDHCKSCEKLDVELRDWMGTSNCRR